MRDLRWIVLVREVVSVRAGRSPSASASNGLVVFSVLGRFVRADSMGSMGGNFTSGRAKKRKTSTAPPYIARNHCVLLHPNFSARAPPIIGAKRGPHKGPSQKIPMALPRSRTSHMSAMVPAPTACTLAAAPPPKIRMTISMAMLFDTAARMFHNRKRVNETR